MKDSQHRKWLKHKQAVEPVIGHLKADHRMDRCWRKGSEGDAIHTVLCAAGFKLRWSLRAISRYGLQAVYLRLMAVETTVAHIISFISGDCRIGDQRLVHAAG